MNENYFPVFFVRSLSFQQIFPNKYTSFFFGLKKPKSTFNLIKSLSFFILNFFFIFFFAQLVLWLWSKNFRENYIKTLIIIIHRFSTEHVNKKFNDDCFHLNTCCIKIIFFILLSFLYLFFFFKQTLLYLLPSLWKHYLWVTIIVGKLRKLWF
jgi:hypothetical protein